MIRMRLRALLLGLVLFAAASAAASQGLPPRAEGEGPYKRLILRGATVIDGTGGPPVGPMDVVVEGNRIAAVVAVGAPGVPIDPAARPKLEGGRELDVSGMYVLPGFVDLYAHPIEPVEYVAKLWLGHGITTIRDPNCTGGVAACLELKRKSAANEVTLPRFEPDVFFGAGGPAVGDPEAARKWVAEVARQGGVGIRFRGQPGRLVMAALEEAERLGVRTSCHHFQDTGVRDTAQRGLDLLEHWHGLPEALFTDRTVPDLPPDYNYLDEQQRFAQSGRLWRQAAAPGSEPWNGLIAELVGRGLTLVPTLSLYEANRDLMRAARAEWHDRYTLPSLWWDRFAPDRTRHAAHFFFWTTDDEIAWRENYRLWLAFLNDYKNRGGRVAVGTDAGFMYNLHGFSFVREMELLREAGFHPLEVIRAATLAGAEALGRASEIGSIEPGKRADLVVVAENPLENLKVLYGTGALKVGADNRPVRTGGVRYTVKDGIVYDAARLRTDVRRLVADAKAREGRQTVLPGLEE